ncbi:outer membrane beta-barrel protein [Crenobacter intestini]|nr:outer membrane beta-barrel protein [Crenobacter intestini]
MHLRRRAGRVGLAALLLGLYGQAGADALDTVQWRAGLRLEHDDNLFARPQDPAGDWLTRLDAGVRLDKQWSRQRVLVDVGVVDYRYRDYDNNDFTATPYQAQWQWGLGNDLGGEFRLSREESPDLTDPAFGARAVNVKKQDTQRAAVQWQFHPSWALNGALGRDKTSYSALTATPDETVRTAELGLRYLSGKGSYVELMQRMGQGEEEVQGDFDERHTRLYAEWAYSAKLKAHLGWGRLSRSYEQGGADYSGNTWQAGARWQITSKVDLTVSADQAVESQLVFRSRTVRNWLVEPRWQISQRLSARANYQHSRADYEQALPGLGQRDDRTRVAGLALDWQLTDPLALSAQWQHEKRSSSYPGLDYARQRYWLGVALAF